MTVHERWTNEMKKKANEPISRVKPNLESKYVLYSETHKTVEKEDDC